MHRFTIYSFSFLTSFVLIAKGRLKQTLRYFSCNFILPQVYTNIYNSPRTE